MRPHVLNLFPFLTCRNTRWYGGWYRLCTYLFAQSLITLQQAFFYRLPTAGQQTLGLLVVLVVTKLQKLLFETVWDSVNMLGQVGTV